MCRSEGWSTRTLQGRLDSMLFERTALSRKPDELLKSELDLTRSRAARPEPRPELSLASQRPDTGRRRDLPLNLGDLTPVLQPPHAIDCVGTGIFKDKLQKEELITLLDGLQW